MDLGHKGAKSAIMCLDGSEPADNGGFNQRFSRMYQTKRQCSHHGGAVGERQPFFGSQLVGASPALCKASLASKT